MRRTRHVPARIASPIVPLHRVKLPAQAAQGIHTPGQPCADDCFGDQGIATVGARRALGFAQ